MGGDTMIASERSGHFSWILKEEERFIRWKAEGPSRWREQQVSRSGGMKQFGELRKHSPGQRNTGNG